MENNYITFTVVFMIALILSILFLKKFIQFSTQKAWLDLPDNRKKHLNPTPSSGGLVFGFLTILISPYVIIYTPYLVPLISAFSLIIVGFYDDRYDMSAKMKFTFQITAIITSLAAIGPLNIISGNPFYVNQILSFLFVLGFTNSFNLLDGLDGLAGSYALTALLIITTLFLWDLNFPAAFITGTITAGLIGFLKFNWNPAKLFMGDTGSLFLGFFISTFTIISVKSGISISGFSISQEGSQSFFLALLLLPMVDTVRVMSTRIINGKGPFTADRSHLHHILKRIGLSAKSVSLFFFLTTLSLIAITLLLIRQNFNFIFVIFALITVLSIIFNGILFIRLRKHKKRLKGYEQSLNYTLKKNQLMQKHLIEPINS